MSNYANIAANYIHAYCIVKFSDIKMASTVANGDMINVFDHCGVGSHKYIPAEKLSMDLNMPVGAGVYGYLKMKDGSFLLKICDGRLAHWSGNTDEPAIWGD